MFSSAWLARGNRQLSGMLMRSGFYSVAAFTAVHRDQAPLLAIELLLFRDDPLVEAAPAQRLSLCLVGGARLFELEDFGHQHVSRQKRP
jgi:hypothetical protein